MTTELTETYPPRTDTSPRTARHPAAARAAAFAGGLAAVWVATIFLVAVAALPSVATGSTVATRTAGAMAAPHAAAAVTFSTVTAAAATGRPTARHVAAAGHMAADLALPALAPAQPTPPAPTPPPTPDPTASPGPGPTTGPMPGPSGAPPNTGATESEDRGWFARRLDEAGDWFARDVVLSGLDPMLKLLGSTLLAIPDPGQVPAVAQLWETSRAIAVSLYGLLVMAAFLIAGTFETLQHRYPLREMLPRLLVGFLAVNLSLWVIGQATTFANALTTALLGQLDARAAAASMRTIISNAQEAEGLWLVFIVAAFVVLLAGLLIGYVVRLALLSLVTVTAPLALACHALPQTEGLARQWWRALGALLVAQFGQALTLALALRLFLAPGQLPFALAPDVAKDMMLFLLLAVMWIMVKLPFWALNQAKGGGLGGGSLLGTVARTWVALKTLGMVKTAAGAATTPGDPGGGRRRRRGGGKPPDTGTTGNRHGPRGPRGGGGGRQGPHVGPRVDPRGGPRPDPTHRPGGAARTPQRPAPVWRTAPPAPPHQPPTQPPTRPPTQPATRPPAGPDRVSVHPPASVGPVAARASASQPAAPGPHRPAQSWRELAVRQRAQQTAALGGTRRPVTPGSAASPAGRAPGAQPTRAGRRPAPTPSPVTPPKRRARTNPPPPPGKR